VKDIRPGPDPSFRGPGYLVNGGGLLFFTADDGLAGTELWRSDGTTAGTVLVEDIGPYPTESRPEFLTVVGGTLFFTAADGVHGRELWALHLPAGCR